MDYYTIKLNFCCLQDQVGLGSGSELANLEPDPNCLYSDPQYWLNNHLFISVGRPAAVMVAPFLVGVAVTGSTTENSASIRMSASRYGI